ncbi:lysozyme [Archangium sp.]|jgi:GH24 family phage-related lysozyme (muramidase)|uniref:lysozyme n=1 Tax=Archangium sp. TaxID=1872627 RepID=UPI002EDB9079
MLKRYQVWAVAGLGAMLGTGCVATQATQTPNNVAPPPPAEAQAEERMVPLSLLEEEPEAVARWVPSADFPELNMSDKGIVLTTKFEGFERKMYNDPVGLCTVGYGHLIKKALCDGTEELEFQQGISRERGVEILRKDMAKAERAVMALVQKPLTQNQFDALVDFVFNAGSGNFQGSSLLKAVNAGKLDEVPNQLRRWTKARGKVLRGLVTRREAEIELFVQGTAISRAAPSYDEELPEIDLYEGEK